MIKAIAITDRGIEKVLSGEIKYLIKTDSKEEDSCVLFDVEKEEHLFRLSYLTQASDRVLILIDKFSFGDYEDFLNKAEQIVKQIDMNQWFKEQCTFRVYCERRGTHDFNSAVVDQDVGGFIIEKTKADCGFEPKVDFKLPSIIFYVFVNDNKAYLGIDLVGRDLSKRNYRIFTAPGTINSKIGFAMGRIAGISKKIKTIDLNSKTGVIPIEAALHENKCSINFYNKDFAFKRIPSFKDHDWDAFFKKIDAERKDDKINITGFDPLLRNLEAAKKNAKLAGIEKQITFSKLDLDWMDAKLDQSTIDLVVSRIQCPSHHFAESSAKKTYKELFYQAEFFLKSGGRMCLLSESLLILKSMLTDDFKLIEEQRLWGGKQEYELVILERK